MTNKITFDRIVLYFTAVIALSVLVLTLRKQFNNTEIAYVDISKLADGYKYKKDLENVSTGKLYKIKGAIDSLKLIKKMEGERVTKIDTQMARAQYAFNEYYAASNREITKKIWDRLNPTIAEYGKDRKMELLIGATGTGNVLFGSKQKDVTDDLISYVNNKYEKGN